MVGKSSLWRIGRLRILLGVLIAGSQVSYAFRSGGGVLSHIRQLLSPAVFVSNWGSFHGDLLILLFVPSERATMASILLGLLFAFLLSLDGRLVHCERPRAINIGALLTFDSVIGEVAKAAIEAAVDDINANTSVLGGTRLNLIMEDTSCGAFQGLIGALRILEKDAVAIIGPQSSTVAHTIAFVSNELQTPLVSFAATDPTLSSIQFPYFLRTTQSDFYQMWAMADLINYYGWKEVITVFVDDDYGRNGVSALGDELAKKLSKIIYKVALPVGASYNDIFDLLKGSKFIGPRVYVVHVNPDSGPLIFSVAQHLHMMTDEYIWLATDWLSTSLDSNKTVGNDILNFEGVIYFRQYVPQSHRRRNFVSRWNQLQGKGGVRYQLNTYGLHAYDTVWGVAHAINELLNESENITFSSSINLQDAEGKVQLGELKTFDNGQLLLKKLLLLNFNGISGPIQFDSEHNLMRGVYEVINVGHSVIHPIGYWSTHSGLSVSVPSNLYINVSRNFSENQHLHHVIWPGGKTVTPRGYVLASRERPLKVGVPYRASYVQFVTKTRETHEVVGYCIDVFKAALELVPYDVPYQFVPFGDGHSNPNYDELVKMVNENVFAAAVGDIAIVTNRTRIVDFTQPYIATGLVIVAPIENDKSSTWVFLRPFTLSMWCATVSFFLMVGFVIWILEHRVNGDFRGPPKRQCTTILLFTFSTLFNSQQEAIQSTLGRMVMMVWLFLLMVITSSYTASLTSFLTVQQLSSPIKGIDNLVASNQPIGYQVGSFARSYLIDSLNVHPSRLVTLGSPGAYETALQRGPQNGGVAAIVDELPYIELFLAKTSGFGIVGQMFTKSGWGGAAPAPHSSSNPPSTDPAWAHGIVVDMARRKVQCKYCDRVLSGGIFRLKQHLAGIKGEVAPCSRVPAEVRMQFCQYMKEKETSKANTSRRRQQIREDLSAPPRRSVDLPRGRQFFDLDQDEEEQFRRASEASRRSNAEEDYLRRTGRHVGQGSGHGGSGQGSSSAGMSSNIPEVPVDIPRDGDPREHPLHAWVNASTSVQPEFDPHDRAWAEGELDDVPLLPEFETPPAPKRQKKTVGARGRSTKHGISIADLDTIEEDIDDETPEPSDNAFPRDYPLAVDMSTAILRLSENGQLEKIHNKWLCKDNCVKHEADNSGPNRLHLSSFWGLFLVCGLVTVTAVLLFLLRAIRQFIRYKRKHQDPSSINVNSSRSCSSVIYSFFDFLDEKEEAIKKMFMHQESSHEDQAVEAPHQFFLFLITRNLHLIMRPSLCGVLSIDGEYCPTPSC
ncbi:hypothetical protein Taro_006092 [Colocasia esculenta]|uniref:BED-type domain-containing protein n=1 Tax=Colocasia esculenta TaxID=4460 RepID=A0A843TWK7_COLES|nr:hypothetical protein [Colocasia esculenta]